MDEADLRRLLRQCEGKDFEARRDTAIIRLLLDTGMRRAELTGLKVEDIDFEHNIAVVLGKGRRPRSCPFGKKTAQALDRYIRARAAHRHADRPELWLARKGPLTASGVYQMVADRAKAAGVGNAYTPPVPSHLCPPVARSGRARGRPDAFGGLALPDDARPLRGECGR